MADFPNSMIHFIMAEAMTALHRGLTRRGGNGAPEPVLGSGTGGVIFSETAPMKLSICSLPELVIFSCESSFSAAHTQALISGLDPFAE